MHVLIARVLFHLYDSLDTVLVLGAVVQDAVRNLTISAGSSGFLGHCRESQRQQLGLLLLRV